MSANEAKARLKINELLVESGWLLTSAAEKKANVIQTTRRTNAAVLERFASFRPDISDIKLINDSEHFYVPYDY